LLAYRATDSVFARFSTRTEVVGLACHAELAANALIRFQAPPWLAW
jgi:hypothetical protein